MPVGGHERASLPPRRKRSIYIAAGLAVPQSDSNPFSSSASNTDGPFEGAVIKFSPAQNAILLVAHVGSDSITYVQDLAIDATGNMYLAGSTRSLDFPLVNPTVSQNLGGITPFLSKISADWKTLVYSTYFGGSGMDTAQGVAVDSSGNAYITGTVESQNFPVLNALYATWDNNADAFLAKFSPTGSLIFSTRYAGMGGATRVAVDGTGAYFVGLAVGAIFPVKNSVEPNQPCTQPEWERRTRRSRWHGAAEFVGETRTRGPGDHRRPARRSRVGVRGTGHARDTAGFRSGACFGSHWCRHRGHAPGRKLAEPARGNHGDEMITG